MTAATKNTAGWVLSEDDGRRMWELEIGKVVSISVTVQESKGPDGVGPVVPGEFDIFLGADCDELVEHEGDYKSAQRRAIVLALTWLNELEKQLLEASPR